MPPGTDLVVVFPVPAAVFQENDIGEIALVVGDESLERACITRAGVNDAVGSLWDGTQVSLRLIIPINGGAVEDPLALVRQIGRANTLSTEATVNDGLKEPGSVTVEVSGSVA